MLAMVLSLSLHLIMTPRDYKNGKNQPCGQLRLFAQKPKPGAYRLVIVKNDGTSSALFCMGQKHRAVWEENTITRAVYMLRFCKAQGKKIRHLLKGEKFNFLTIPAVV